MNSFLLYTSRSIFFLCLSVSTDVLIQMMKSSNRTKMPIGIDGHCFQEGTIICLIDINNYLGGWFSRFALKNRLLHLSSEEISVSHPVLSFQKTLDFLSFAEIFHCCQRIHRSFLEKSGLSQTKFDCKGTR